MAARYRRHKTMAGQLCIFRTRCELHLAPATTDECLGRGAAGQVATLEQESSSKPSGGANVWLHSEERDREPSSVLVRIRQKERAFYCSN